MAGHGSDSGRADPPPSCRLHDTRHHLPSKPYSHVVWLEQEVMGTRVDNAQLGRRDGLAARFRAVGIGTLRCVVLDVEDLTVAESFWSEVTGLEVIGSGYTGRFSYLGNPDPWRHEIILQLVDRPKQVESNRSHPDITVDDIDVAIDQIVAIGGSVKKPPSIYPRPGSFPGKPPVIDWAVMADPFGNEFCLVSELTEEESRRVEAATNAVGDQEWRAAAGRTTLS